MAIPALLILVHALDVQAQGSDPVADDAPSSASSAAADEPIADMALHDATLFAPPSGVVHFRLGLPGGWRPDDELTLTVHQRVDAAQFALTAVGGARPGVLRSWSFDVSELAPDERDEVTLTVPVDSRGTAQHSTDNAARALQPVRLVRAGVYPVSIELLTAQQDPVGRLDTYLIGPDSAAPGPNAKPGAATRTPMPVVVVASLASLDAANRGEQAVIERWLDTLGTHADLPMRLDVSPGTFEQPELAHAAQRFADAMTAPTAQAVLGRLSAIPLDLAGLDAAGLSSDADLLMAQGVAVLKRHGRLAPSAQWHSRRPTDASGTAARVARGAKEIIVEASALRAEPEPNPSRATTADTAASADDDADADTAQPAPHAPFALVVNDSIVRAIATEPLLAPRRADTATAAAHRQIAQLAARALAADEPGLATIDIAVAQDRDGRDNRDGRSTAAATLQTTPEIAGIFLALLRRADFLAPISAAEAFGRPLATDPDGQPQRFGLPQRAWPSADYSDYLVMQRHLDAYRSALGESEAQLISDRAVAGRALLSIHATPREQAQQWRNTVDWVRAQLRLLDGPPEGTIRLTARSASVPFSFRNRSPYRTRLEFRLLSPKLVVEDFDDGETTTLWLEPGVTRYEFRLRTHSSGAFPASVEMYTPDGALFVRRSTLVIQSTAPTGSGLVLGGSAAAALAVWWVVHVSRRRRSRTQ